MMMMRMTMIMDTMFMMIKSLPNQFVLLHRGDVMIHDEYADDFDDMVFMMFMMMITLHNLVYASFFLQCDTMLMKRLIMRKIITMMITFQIINLKARLQLLFI